MNVCPCNSWSNSAEEECEHFMSEHMIPDVVRGNMEVQRKKVTKENLEFHVQGQIELTRTF